LFQHWARAKVMRSWGSEGVNLNNETRSQWNHSMLGLMRRSHICLCSVVPFAAAAQRTLAFLAGKPPSPMFPKQVIPGYPTFNMKGMSEECVLLSVFNTPECLMPLIAGSCECCCLPSHDSWGQEFLLYMV
jgi:hypothetical protein